jgi:hypothetical protein
MREERDEFKGTARPRRGLPSLNKRRRCGAVECWVEVMRPASSPSSQSSLVGLAKGCARDSESSVHFFDVDAIRLLNCQCQHE